MSSEMSAGPRFSNNLPGGNGELVGWDETAGRITVRPELRDGSPYRGWYFFRLDGLEAGRPYQLDIVENMFAGVAVWSASQDGPWHQFEAFHRVSRDRFEYAFVPDHGSRYIAMMPPYRLEHLRRLIAELAPTPSFSARDAWTSEEGRPGVVLRVGPGVGDSPSRTSRPRIWFTARMHGFEAVSSWVAEGLVRWAALSQEAEACWLRENADLFVAPLVDVDSVERGGTGKYRAPICFARDAGPCPHWTAIRTLVETWEREGPPDVFHDLHGPGGDVEDIYFYTPLKEYTTPAYEADLACFTQTLDATRVSRLPYHQRQFRCPPGPDSYGQAMSGTAYLYLHGRYFGRGRLRLSIASETPWGHPGYDCRAFLDAGADYARATVRLLRGIPGAAQPCNP